MKSLLRKKPPADSQRTSQPAQAPARPPSNAAQAPPELPLYARFASSKQALSQQDDAGKTRPVVSGPMPLGKPGRIAVQLELDERRRRSESDNVDPRRKAGNARQEHLSKSQAAPATRPPSQTSVPQARQAKSPPQIQASERSTVPPTPATEQRAPLQARVSAADLQRKRDTLPPPPIPPFVSPSPYQLDAQAVSTPSRSNIPSVVSPRSIKTDLPALPTAASDRAPMMPNHSLPPTSGLAVSISTSNLSAPPPVLNYGKDDLIPRNVNLDSPSTSLGDFRMSFEPLTLTLAESLNQDPATTESPNEHQRQSAYKTSFARTEAPLPAPPPPIPQPSQMPSKTLPAPPPVSLDAPGGKPSKHATQLYTQPSFSASHPTNNTPVLRSQVQTPPQSPDGYQCVSEGTNAPVPVRRESQTRSPVRGRPLIFASLDAQPEEPPSSRRGPLIFNRRDQQQPDLRNGPKSPIRATPYGTRPPSWFGDPSSIDGMQPEVSSAPPPLIKQQPGSGPDPRVASTEPAHATRDVGGQAPRHASPAPQTSQSPLAQRPPHLNSAHSHPYDERAPSPPHHLRKTRHPTLSRGSVDLSNIPADSTSTPRSSTAHEHDPAATARARKSSRTLNGATSASLSDLGESAQPQHRASHRVLTKHRPITPVSPKSQPPPPLGSPAEIEPQRLGRKSWQAPSVAEARIMEAAPTPPEKADVRASFGEPAPLSARTGARTPVRAELQLRDIPDEPADEPEPAQALEEDRAEAYVLVPEVRPRQLPTPPSPEEYSRARARRRGEWLEKAPPEEVVDVAQQTLPTFYPLARHLQDPVLLAALLNYFSFYDWLVFSNTTKAIKAVLDRNRDAQEAVLERFLGTVGYTRWTWLTPEPLQLTLKELHAYMKGVSLPTHQYAHTAAAVLSTPPTPEQHDLTRSLKKATRAFTRVVLRLRAHAEAEAEQIAAFRRAMPLPPSNGNSRHHSSAGPPPSWSTGAASAPPARRALSRQTSRAPSPTGSTWSHNTSQVHLPLSLHDRREPSPSFSRFRSPLFRLRRAPLLQVFVPSPEGDWLSDSSILECEAELRKAGVLELLRAGDVVWDTAVGDEGNVGRLIWDGRYLIDLDYTYSPIGDLPRYLPTLAFPPSYFHRVIRIAGDKNPICHIDVRPWAEEIASNLQLLQDRVKTETPQGNYHTVVRWVHRSSFTIRPPQSVQPPMIVMPTKERRGVDPGWYGLVVVEAEGTNEGLEDLQERCRGAFPPRAAGPRAAPRLGERERTVWRIMRERSRPGEIWISTVSYKERLLP